MDVGRSLQSIKLAYYEKLRLERSESNPPLKRGATDSAETAGRRIMPKPGPGPTALLQHSQQAPLSPMTPHPAQPESTRKKRGRPSKKDLEARRQAADLLRHERAGSTQLASNMYASGPPLGGQIGYASSVPQTPVAAGPPQPSYTTSTPQQGSRPPSSNASNSSGKRRKGRPQTAPSTAPPPFQFPPGSHSQAYDTPPHTATRDERRPSDTSSRDPPTSASVPPEGPSRPMGAEAEDSKSSEWRKTVFNKSA